MTYICAKPKAGAVKKFGYCPEEGRGQDMAWDGTGSVSGGQGIYPGNKGL